MIRDLRQCEHHFTDGRSPARYPIDLNHAAIPKVKTLSVEQHSATYADVIITFIITMVEYRGE
jgi:hypothetical protein